jgi:hypothetical protein
MDDDLTPYLSPKAIKILTQFKRYRSPDAFFAAHPEITQQDTDDVTAEIVRAMEMIGGSPEAAKQRAGRKKKRKPSDSDAYQLKITLRGSKPPIWRRVVVPGGITLYELHEVIQLAMGWTNSHLHLFEIDGRQFQALDPELGNEFDSEDETQYQLDEVVDRVKVKFRYEYDFGDSWEHLVVVEKIIPASAKPKLMVCTAGKGNCPMEDSGGIWGYYQKLAILADPSNPDHEEIKEWMGDEFDALAFDLDRVNKALAHLR